MDKFSSAYKFFDESTVQEEEKLDENNNEITKLKGKKPPGKNLAKINKNTFTHFICFPLMDAAFKNTVFQIQRDILSLVENEDEQKLYEINNPNLLHVTIGFLCLSEPEKLKKAIEILEQSADSVKKMLTNKKLSLEFGGIKCFETLHNKPQRGRKALGSTKFIYAEILQNENTQVFEKISDALIRALIKAELIDPDDLKTMKIKYDERSSLFKPFEFHMTLFRVKSDEIMEITTDVESILKKFGEKKIGELEIKYLDVSTCNQFDKDGFYKPFFRLELA